MNRICIQGLEVEARIGVPEEERSKRQSLKIDVVMIPNIAFGAMDDDVDRTIDYHAVSLAIADLAAIGERKLIETLASEIADMLITKFHAVETNVRIRKYILPQTEWVAVECTRKASS